MYDLAWVAQHQRDIGGLDLDLVRRLTVLKIWVDANGVAGSEAVWKPGHEPRSFDPATWLRRRSAREFDLDDIGALAIPVPTAAELARLTALRKLINDLQQVEANLMAQLEAFTPTGDVEIDNEFRTRLQHRFVDVVKTRRAKMNDLAKLRTKQVQKINPTSSTNSPRSSST